MFPTRVTSKGKVLFGCLKCVVVALLLQTDCSLVKDHGLVRIYGQHLGMNNVMH